jgi:ketosteroid isomerase-like protein
VAPKAQPPVDARTAESDAKGVLDEIYESVGHADTDSLLTLAVDPLVVYGPRKADVHTSRADALVALKAIVDKRAGQRPRPVTSGELAVVASPGGHSAWAVDVIVVGGEPMAFTAVLSNIGDVWQVAAADLAATPPMKSVRAEVKHDAVVPPGMAGVAKIDPAAKLAVDKLTKGLVDQSILGDDLASRSDAVFAGPGSGDIVRGKDELKKLFKKRIKDNVRETAAGQMTAATTADGQLAWVTMPVVRFEEDLDPIPLRVFAVFEKHDADWKLIALQESVAVDAPGSAASFKKLAPPAKPAEPAPAKTELTVKTTVKTEKPVKPPKVEKPAKVEKPDAEPEAAPASTGDDDDAPPPPKKKKHHKKKHKKPPPPDDDAQ